MAIFIFRIPLPPTLEATTQPGFCFSHAAREASGALPGALPARKRQVSGSMQALVKMTQLRDVYFRKAKQAGAEPPSFSIQKNVWWFRRGLPSTLYKEQVQIPKPIQTT